MTRIPHNSDPAAFLSYSHLDDDAEPGRIGSLVRVLEGKVSLQLGQPFRIFIDRRDMRWGERWPQKIDDALDDVLLLIPILTPAYFKSRICRREYRHFLAREESLGRSDLILPVYYVEADQLERARWTSPRTWAANITVRQYFDWRLLRLCSIDSSEVVRAIENMAVGIRAAIQRRKATVWQKGTTMIDSVKTKQLSADQIDDTFRALSPTQKYIVFALYTLVHPPEIAVDDLLYITP